MENIKDWFEELKGQNPDWEIVIDKVIEGLGERGFNSIPLNQLVDHELDKIKTDYENLFIKDIDDNA